jgi:hypothetical protein
VLTLNSFSLFEDIIAPKISVDLISFPESRVTSSITTLESSPALIASSCNEPVNSSNVLAFKTSSVIPFIWAMVSSKFVFLFFIIYSNI